MNISFWNVHPYKLILENLYKLIYKIWKCYLITSLACNNNVLNAYSLLTSTTIYFLKILSLISKDKSFFRIGHLTNHQTYLSIWLNITNDTSLQCTWEMITKWIGEAFNHKKSNNWPPKTMHMPKNTLKKDNTCNIGMIDFTKGFKFQLNTCDSKT
jgi:hypothetical protein